jgi:type IV secretory pathway TraG/TraD family ATPase VirD4
MAYRANVTDKAQDELEQATFDGMPVMTAGGTRVITSDNGGAAKTFGPSGSVRGAGVVVPHDDILLDLTNNTGKA